jgi:hypothetical protein
MRRSFGAGCCARAASGQATVEPAIAVMKSRRRMCPPKAGDGAVSRASYWRIAHMGAELRDFDLAYDRFVKPGPSPMSAQRPVCPPKADVERTSVDSLKCATTGLMRCSKTALLFDHLVGGREQCRRHG